MTTQSFKLTLLNSPARSNILNNGLDVMELVKAWNKLAQSFAALYKGSFQYSDWLSGILEIQNILFEQIVDRCDSKPSMEDISIIVYSTMPEDLKRFLGDNIADFVICITFPNFSEGPLQEYKRHLSWLDKMDIKMNNPLGKRDYFPWFDLQDFIRSDFLARKDADKALKDITVGEDFRVDPRYPITDPKYQRYCRGIIWRVRFLSYLLASNPVSYVSMVLLLSGLKQFAGNCADLLSQVHGEFNFALSCRIGFSCIQDQKLKLLLQNAAFVLSQPSFDNEEEINDVRIRAIARWFKPWYDIDLLSNSPSDGKQEDMITNMSEFESAVNAELENILRFDDLDYPLDAVDFQDIHDVFNKVFARTEISLEFIDLILRKNNFNNCSNNFEDAVIFFVTMSVEAALGIDLSETPLPWDYIDDPLKLTCFDGTNSDRYHLWRNYAMKRLMAEESGDKAACLKSLLTDPILSELDIALDAKRGKAPKLETAETGVLEIFTYLDKTFKFKVDPIWGKSDLYKRIKTVVSGISNKSEKDKAVLASTWKCSSFEQYMEIVSFF
jgi:hypothetical protein